MCKNLLDFLRILLAYSFRGIHDTLVPITQYLAELFESLRVDGVRPPRIRASDMRHVLLVLPFLLHDLLKDEVAAFNIRYPVGPPIVDPSAELIEVTLMLLSWYHLLRQRCPPKDDRDIADLRTMAEAYQQKCKTVFPYKNKQGYHIMENEKMHSMVHSGNDVANFGDSINFSAEAPETAHKKWIKEQGGNTNQGDSSKFTMMNHCRRKEAAALLCEAVQGVYQILTDSYKFLQILTYSYVFLRILQVVPTMETRDAKMISGSREVQGQERMFLCVQIAGSKALQRMTVPLVKLNVTVLLIAISDATYGNGQRSGRI